MTRTEGDGADSRLPRCRVVRLLQSGPDLRFYWWAILGLNQCKDEISIPSLTCGNRRLTCGNVTALRAAGSDIHGKECTLLFLVCSSLFRHWKVTVTSRSTRSRRGFGRI